MARGRDPKNNRVDSDTRIAQCGHAVSLLRARRQRRASLVIMGCIGVLALVMIARATAADLTAGPANYREVVGKLRAGDTLRLASGIYRHGLDIHGLEGSIGAPIEVRGARSPGRAVFVAAPGRNTVSIANSAHVKIADLDLVGGELPVDAVKAEGTSRYAHHITLEGLRITGHGADQQNVAISTKCPAWGWTIRGNAIIGAGTGLYLGNSDGSAPFIRGLIERNIIIGTRGYSMQIKHQMPWPDLPEIASDPGDTIVRYNTFAKDERSSTGDLARPNLLLGHWPLAGKGSRERYLVYGNLFLDNPAEVLLQAEGNVTVYNNVFINRFGDAVAIREHNDVPRSIDFFHNTIVARGVGVLLRNGDPAAKQTISGNAIFADQVTPPSVASQNLLSRFERAGNAGRNAAGTPPPVDLAAAGRSVDDRQWNAAGREDLPDVALDFDHQRRMRPVYGAYAGVLPADSRRLDAAERERGSNRLPRP